MSFFGQWLREFRRERDLTGKEIGEKLGVSQAFVAKMESGIKNPSDELLESFFDSYRISDKSKLEIREMVALDKSPELIQKKYISMKNKTKETDNYDIEEGKKISIKVFEYDTSKTGRVNLDKFTEESFMLDSQISNELEDGMVIKVKGNYMQPHFYEGDMLLIETEKFESWQELDKKIVLYRLEEEIYIRKVLFEKGKGYLVAFNINHYENIEIKENIEYIGKLRKQINIRNLDDIEF